ncbi:hypothetical protein [Pelagibius sp.]|uniref:phosphorylase family protein n=1 Tax=Pelagibius sp. TaxID=1931238 RepID=UPI003B50482F
MNATATRLGIVTGLASEARLVTETGARSSRQITVVCAGADSARAVQLAEDLVAGGATALLSFGIAGALHPALAVGDLVLAKGVRSPSGQHHSCHDDWHRTLHVRLHKGPAALHSGTIYGSTETLLTVAQKSRAHSTSACLAVDMESHAVAAVADRAGLPFLALRAIADTAGDALPALAARAVTPEGTADWQAALSGLARRPGDLPSMLRLAGRTRRALASLEAVSRDVEELFGRFG